MQVDMYANRFYFSTGLICLLVLPAVLASVMLFWLWHASRISTFAAGFFYGCVAVVFFLFSALFCFGIYHDRVMLKRRTIDELSKAEARRDRFAGRRMTCETCCF
jgi:membrane protein implicated in regulation of membrane protease activity